jgi:hypothetical protein
VCDGAFPELVWISVILLLVEGGVVYFCEALMGGEEIEDVAEGDAEGEEVPEEGDGIGGLACVGCCGEGEVVVEAADAEEACTEVGALLVEGGGLGGGLVEESVVGDGSIDLEARA